MSLRTSTRFLTAGLKFSRTSECCPAKLCNLFCTKRIKKSETEQQQPNQCYAETKSSKQSKDAETVLKLKIHCYESSESNQFSKNITQTQKEKTIRKLKKKK